MSLRLLSACCGVLVLVGCMGDVLQGPDGLAIESAVVMPAGPVSDSVVFTLTMVNVSGREVALLNVGDPQWLFDVLAWDSGGHLVWRLHPYPLAGPSHEPPWTIAPRGRWAWSAVWHLEATPEGWGAERLRVSPGTYWLVGFLSGAGGLVRTDSVRVEVALP